MADLIVKHEALQELLQGYLDPVQRKCQRELGDVPIGETGLTRRLWEINYLSHYTISLRRFANHRFAHNFDELLQHSLWTAETTLTVELLRLLDPPSFRGKRSNLTISLYHDRLQESLEVAPDEKDTERLLYEEISEYTKQNPVDVFRNRQMFHLDLEECLKLPDYSGTTTELTRLIVQWYSFAGGIVTGGEPKYVTEGAPARGRSAAKSLVRSMLDSIRYQMHRWPHSSQVNRYGLCSNSWYEEMYRTKERASVVALSNEVIVEMGDAGSGIQIEEVTKRSGQEVRKDLQFHCPNDKVEAEFVRRFNQKAEANGDPWQLESPLR